MSWACSYAGSYDPGSDVSVCFQTVQALGFEAVWWHRTLFCHGAVEEQLRQELGPSLPDQAVASAVGLSEAVKSHMGAVKEEMSVRLVMLI